MFETIEWKDVYKLWKTGCCYFPQMLSNSVSAETIFVEYKQEGYFYGYDWLRNDEVTKRKELIERNPISFIYFTKPTNKGTIQTAEMLTDCLLYTSDAADEL